MCNPIHKVMIVLFSCIKIWHLFSFCSLIQTSRSPLSCWNPHAAKSYTLSHELSLQKLNCQITATLSTLTSMMGLDASTFSSTLVSLAEPPTVAKKRMAYFAETVFPAPDSPLTMMD